MMRRAFFLRRVLLGNRFFRFQALLILCIAGVPCGASFGAEYTENFDDGLAQNWTVVQGTWDVTAGAYHVGNGAQATAVYDGGSWASDFGYHVRINNSFSGGGNLAGVVYNYQDACNYYEIKFAAVGGAAYLNRVLGCQTTTVRQTSYSGGGTNVWFEVDIFRSGPRTTVYVNDRSVFVDVVQTELGAGKIGLTTNWSDARFDNVSFNSGLRDALAWPFSTTSIWNAPIGSNAVYEYANIPPLPFTTNPDDPYYWVPMPFIDRDVIVLTPDAPITDIYYSAAAWSGGDRCPPTLPPTVLFQLPIPGNFVVANGNDNNSAALLKPDGRTVVQTQPLTRCVANGPGTTLTPQSDVPQVDLNGDGIRGSHGGSSLSALGGAIRFGELRPGSQGPRHALALNVYSALLLYNCQNPDGSDCFRWPAAWADSHAPDTYGTLRTGNSVQMKMGALLAIPAGVDLQTMGLETEPGMQVAWTLQNYGAYINDTHGAYLAGLCTPADECYKAEGFSFDAESRPNPATGQYEWFTTQFDADYPALQGFEQRWGNNSPWTRDMNRLMTALHVVTNNGPNSIGGGGTPRQPLAAPLVLTRFDENKAAFAGGSWVPRGAEVALFSNGSAQSSNVTGGAATLTFTGSVVSWIGLKCNVCGIATVSIDGGAATSVDTAGTAAPGSAGLTSEAVFTASGLSGGSHTITITATGTTTSGDSHVVVDAFDVVP